MSKQQHLEPDSKGTAAIKLYTDLAIIIKVIFKMIFYYSTSCIDLIHEAATLCFMFYYFQSLAFKIFS